MKNARFETSVRDRNGLYPSRSLLMSEIPPVNDCRFFSKTIRIYEEYYSETGVMFKPVLSHRNCESGYHRLEYSLNRRHFQKYNLITNWARSESSGIQAHRSAVSAVSNPNPRLQDLNPRLSNLNSRADVARTVEIGSRSISYALPTQ